MINLLRTLPTLLKHPPFIYTKDDTTFLPRDKGIIRVQKTSNPTTKRHWSSKFWNLTFWLTASMSCRIWELCKKITTLSIQILHHGKYIPICRENPHTAYTTRQNKFGDTGGHYEDIFVLQKFHMRCVYTIICWVPNSIFHTFLPFRHFLMHFNIGSCNIIKQHQKIFPTERWLCMRKMWCQLTSIREREQWEVGRHLQESNPPPTAEEELPSYYHPK